jgi:peptide/nickel transport system substrate-binding protein
LITLTRPSSTFLTALSLPAFSMASPTALDEFGADDVGGDGEAPEFTGTYGYEHPTGTGPYKFDSWERGERVVLTANGDYWGENTPNIGTLIFTAIADGPARRQALEAGEIDGYDLVDPADAEALAADGFTILQRPAFNVGYIGFNSSMAPLDNPDVRKAVAYAINKENILSTKYPEGAQVATQFMPPELFGWSDGVEEYAYDPDMARQLLADSGVTNPTIEFWYPTDVSRPYMPDPEGNFELIKADLEAVGFTVTPKSAPWNPDYLAANQAGTQQMYLLGWTGDFGDPDNFIGTFFQTEQAQWGFDEPDIFDALDAAEAETDLETRTQMYIDINNMIMDFVPGVPYVHTQPAIAFKPGIDGYEPSPVNNEDFATVTISE